MRRIFLLGYFGAGNFGDDALLVDWLLKHRTLLAAHYACDLLSRSAAPLAAFAEEPRLAPLLGNCHTPRTAMRLRAQDYAALVAPGGSLLQDATSLRSLLFYLWLIQRFTAARKPVFLMHQGLGPLLNPLARLWAVSVLRRVATITLRDEPSYTWLREQLPQLDAQQLTLSADPILAGQFALPDGAGVTPVLPPYALFIPKPTGDLPHRGDPTTEAAALATLLTTLHGMGLPTVILPLHVGQDERFARETAIASPASQLVLPTPPAGTHSWRLIAGAALVVSYRLHGLVSAAACGVPGFGVAYDPKISAFCEEIGFPWCYPAEVHVPGTLAEIADYAARLPQAALTLQRSREPLLLRLARAEDTFARTWTALGL